MLGQCFGPTIRNEDIAALFFSNASMIAMFQSILFVLHCTSLIKKGGVETLDSTM